MDSELWKLCNSPFAKSRKRSSRKLFAWIGSMCARERTVHVIHLYAYACACVSPRSRARAAWACADTHGFRLRVIPVEAYWSSSELRRFAHAHKSSRKQDKYHRASPENPSARPSSLRCPEMSIRYNRDSFFSGSTLPWLKYALITVERKIWCQCMICFNQINLFIFMNE